MALYHVLQDAPSLQGGKRNENDDDDNNYARTQTVSKDNKTDVQDMEDKGMQTEREKDRHPRRGPAVKKMIKRKSPICIVGDSMMKNTGAHLHTSVSGSSLECLRGARIQDIKKTVAD